MIGIIISLVLAQTSASQTPAPQSPLQAQTPATSAQPQDKLTFNCTSEKSKDENIKAFSINFTQINGNLSNIKLDDPDSLVSLADNLSLATPFAVVPQVDEKERELNNSAKKMTGKISKAGGYSFGRMDPYLKLDLVKSATSEDAFDYSFAGIRKIDAQTSVNFTGSGGCIKSRQIDEPEIL